MGSARSTDGVSAEISVLVVEDDAPTRWRIVDALSRDADFRVTDAANLAEARRFLFTGMIGSTCLTVVFVPSLFVVL